MGLKINDYVQIPIAKMALDDATKYLYGLVKLIDYPGNMVNVELYRPYKGVRYTSIPMYFAKKLTSDEYKLMTIGRSYDSNIECDHNWIKSGQGINMKANEFWYNCKTCGIAKEKA